MPDDTTRPSAPGGTPVPRPDHSLADAFPGGTSRVRLVPARCLPVPKPPAPPRLLDRVRTAIRTRHYSPRTEKAYVGWIRRYIFFHEKRHPDVMGATEVSAFLAALAVREKVSASTQNQAFSALLFLYREVLGRELTGLEDGVRAKRPVRLPVVLSRQEVTHVLSYLHGAAWLMASLMYGSGLRVLEAARLRIKDLDMARGEITVRDGKGRKDRVTILPGALIAPLTAHIERIRPQHEADLKRGEGCVELPDALDRSTRTRARTGAGNGSSPRPASIGNLGVVGAAATTFTKPFSSGTSLRPFGRRHSPSRRPATVSVTRSPPISWRSGTTSAPSRNSWATTTSARR